MDRLAHATQEKPVSAASAKNRPVPCRRATPVTEEDWSRGQPGPIGGIRVGIGGWTYAPWRGNFYPGGLVQRRELEFASRHVSSIEINGTYHRAQTQATYARWRDQTPDDFLFSVKAPRRIVQSRALEKTGTQVEDFIGGIAELGAKLGPLVWQFDAGLSKQRAGFEAFCKLLPKTADGRALRHVLDVRDAAFADAEFLALARRHGHATAFTDSPEHPSFADITGDFVYARLMQSRTGIGSGYPAQELKAWAARAREWARGQEPADLPRIDAAPATRAPREVFIYFINAAKERNPAAAVALIERLQRT